MQGDSSWTYVHKLRLLTNDTPGIYPGVWLERQAEGWRWLVNLYARKNETEQRVRDAIEQYGPSNVSVGHPFSVTSGWPYANDSDMIGLYAKGDIKGDIFTLYRDFDRWLGLDPDDPFGDE